MISPLDWGLGHVTRCIPIIRYLLRKGHRVTLAADEKGSELLQANFPGIRILPLAGYGVRYSKRRAAFTANLISQIPRILTAVRSEHRWLRNVNTKESFDLVISDNRYGLFHPDVCSVILTHQPALISGVGAAADQMVQRLHYRMLQKFNACWIVDNEGAPNLAGALSHPASKPANATYIGPLSQFEPGEKKPKPGKILFLLSGPEPMRGQFERKILDQVGMLSDYETVMVAGAVGQTPPENIPTNLKYHSWLEAKALQHKIETSELVVCRSGYSTIMDLAVLKKKALLVPTPGQSEQEYLAKNLRVQSLFFTKNQEELELISDLPQALAFPGFQGQGQETVRPAFHSVMDELLAKISTEKTAF